MQFVDTHAHLDGEKFQADLGEVVSRAVEARVGAIISAGQDEATSHAAIALTSRFPCVFAAVGVHPHEAGGAGALDWLPGLARHARVVAVGETGLDYHYDFSPRATQREVFSRQLQLAQRLALPVIIHCREAVDDLGNALRSDLQPGHPAVWHCFTERFETGNAFIREFGIFLGIGGAVTFKNAHELHDAATRLPLENLLLETDCPYMAPVPYRGKRNEPAYIPLVADRLAQLRGIGVEEVAARTTANALRLFSRLSLDAEHDY